MPRPLRIEYNGAWYHVMNRGIDHMEIYLNDMHRAIFLELLAEISALFQIRIHSYCLMGNHYHLLLETPLANLNKGMRHLNCLYTQRFNRLEKRDGPLFRGRYKSVLIENESYLLKVSRYIHLNPLEAKMVHELSAYRWSSYNYFINSRPPVWLCTSYLNSLFGGEKNYLEYVGEGIDEEISNFYKSSKLSPILGTSKFIHETLSKLNLEYKIDTSPEINRAVKSYTLKEICHAVTVYFNIDARMLKTSCRNNLSRMLAIFLARNLTQLSHKKISEYFSGINKSSISKTVNRCKYLIENDESISQHHVYLMKILRDES